MPVFTGPELCHLTAVEAVELLRKKEVSPAELLEASLSRIEAVSPQINATVTVCAARARAAINDLATDPDQPGWLGGLPIGIKDLNLVKGVRTSFATKGLADFVPDQSDPLVERLEARGGIVVGKSNTPEMGAGGNTTNAVFGATRNPWNVAKNAGGSSGGAAASLAAGEVWLSQGSDLAGSIRTPSAYCGIVGLRPSPGRAGGGPAALAFEREALAGPMARNVGDTALFLDAMAGFDARHPLSIEPPTVSFQDTVAADPGPIRIGFSPDLDGFAPVEPEIKRVMETALHRAAGEGVRVEHECPDISGLEETYLTLRGIHYGALTAKLPLEIRQHFKPTLQANIAFGLALTADDIFKAQAQRSVLYQNMRIFLETWDVLALPVVGLEPTDVEVEYPSEVGGIPVNDYVEWLKFSFLGVVTTLPSLSIPCGFTKSGMPVGLQLIGPPRGEARLLQVARRLEAIWGYDRGVPIDPVGSAK